jgi:hypothetical protein
MNDEEYEDYYWTSGRDPRMSEEAEWENYYWNSYIEPPDLTDEDVERLDVSESASGWGWHPEADTILKGEFMKYSEEVAHRVLHLPMGDNDANAATVGEYLGLLLSTLWLEKEGFSGKRPFGNSSWDMDVYIALSKAGLCELELDEDGYVESFSHEAEVAADELILQAIRLMYHHG